MAYGFIYIAVNETMPGLVKIGQTTIAPSERVRQLSQATGVPKPFELYSAYEVESPKESEAEVHKYLAECRCNRTREFFEISPIEAHSILESGLGVVNFMPTVLFSYDQWKAKQNEN